MTPPERTRNGEHVTLARVMEITAETERRLRHDIEPRLRRVEFALVALFAATASPKIGGPSLSGVVSGLFHLIFS